MSETPFATMEESLTFWQKRLSLVNTYGSWLLCFIASVEKRYSELTNQKAKEEMGVILQKMYGIRDMLLAEYSREQMDHPVPLYMIQGLPILEQQLKTWHGLESVKSRKSKK